MPRYSVFFEKVLPSSIEFKSDDEHLIGEVCFQLYVDGKYVGEFSADVKQTVGGRYEDIEVGLPKGYDGLLDFIGFSDAAKEYILSLVGPDGKLLRFGENAHHITIQGITLLDNVKYSWFFDPQSEARQQFPPQRRSSS